MHVALAGGGRDRQTGDRVSAWGQQGTGSQGATSTSGAGTDPGTGMGRAGQHGLRRVWGEDIVPLELARGRSEGPARGWNGKWWQQGPE